MRKILFSTVMGTLALSCAASKPPLEEDLRPPSPSQVPTEDRAAATSETDLRSLLQSRRLRVIGRYATRTNGSVLVSWSGTGLELRFEGTGLRLTHRGPRVRYQRTLDGRVLEDFFFAEGQDDHQVVAHLPEGEHTLRLERQGEALFGVSTFSQIIVDGGQLLELEAPRRKYIEVYGDSITCGYGNEGKSVDCGLSPETENHAKSYGRILADRFGAELSAIAWSGKGVASNYAGDTAPTLTAIHRLAVPQNPEQDWHFPEETHPAAVIVNLGTNDYSTDHDPSDARFIAEYERLLRSIRSSYPQAFILATVGPLLGGQDLVLARKNIQAVVDRLVESGDPKVASYAMQTTNENPGCDYHPGLSTHEQMATELEAQLRPHLDE